MPLLNRKGMCAVMLALGLGASTAGAEVVIVVSAKSAVTTLNQNQVADIFLGQDPPFPRRRNGSASRSGRGFASA